ncbi:MAG TPA: hypothetical protein PLZ32_09350, partial [Saprospiraceae bacterium]|nr:hypothetical protein [Saprospiraceae bacterium]
VISGIANQDGFYASAKLVKLTQYDEQLFESLLKENYHLRYTKFALDEEDHLILIFFTAHVNASPQFLYRGLRELALLSDTRDDIIIADYDFAIPVNMEVIRKASKVELDLKFNYFNDILQEVKNIFDVEKLSKKDHPGIYAYVLLAAVFKLDYLVKPEGKILETIIEVHRIFYHTPFLIDKKIELMYQQFLRLTDYDRKRFEIEIYDTISTFGILQHCNREKIIDILYGELHQAEWYITNGYPEQAKAITDYAVGYLLYSFEISEEFRPWLHLYYEITEHRFFSKMGFKFKSSDGVSLKKKTILKRIDEIKNTLPKTENEFQKSVNLKYESVEEFAFSYLSCIVKNKK